jgi:catechol 2,3-dioxygenase-like lactoylglutathione lyase family enzyme
MPLQGIDHVQVAAPPGCEPAARAFYGELLGLREVAKPAQLAARGGVWFAIGRQELHVGVEEDFHPARKAHPALTCSDLDEVARRLQAAGSPVRWDGVLPGVRRFHTSDPFGNRLELVAVSLSSAF